MKRREARSIHAHDPDSRLRLVRVRPSWRRASAGPIERASPDDLMELATDSGSAPMQVGAVLRLECDGPFPIDDATTVLGRRLAVIPRLGQRLVRVPAGCGRPIWVDDATFVPEDHIETIRCPAPGGEPELLAIAADRLVRRLPADRPLWSATFVTGMADGTTALIVIFHHVLADGLGGLAMLASLVDGMPEPPARRPASPLPTRPALVADAARSALDALGRLPKEVVEDLRTIGAFRRARPRPAPRTSLNQPTGPRRALAIVEVPLDDVRARARTEGGTVNDVVLAWVTGALARVLRDRDEAVDHLVVSVPVAGRVSSGPELGNQVGVMPVSLPTTGTPDDRLSAIAAITARRKTEARRGSAAIMVPILRLLGTLHLLRPLIDRQHLVNTFVTNLRGPAEPVSFCGATVTGVMPLTTTTGNVIVAFAVLSYAGTLNLVADLDPDSPLCTGELVDALSLERAVLIPSPADVRR